MIDGRHRVLGSLDLCCIHMLMSTGTRAMNVTYTRLLHKKATAEIGYGLEKGYRLNKARWQSVVPHSAMTEISISKPKQAMRKLNIKHAQTTLSKQRHSQYTSTRNKYTT